MEDQTNLRNHGKRNQRGFALISGLMLIPLLTSCILGGWLLNETLIQMRVDSNTCRRIALQTQHELSKILKELLQLNPRAQKLRLKWRVAQKSLAAALASGNIAAIAAARMQMQVVQSLRLALSAEQQFLWRKATFERTAFGARISKLNSANWQAPLGGLALVPMPAGDLTPDYVPIEPFRKTQAYPVQGLTIAPKIINQILHDLKIKQIAPIQLYCGASLEKKGRTWITVLEAGKSS